MTSTQELSSRLPSLTGLRFVGATFVFVAHGVNLFLFADPSVQKNYSFWAGSNLGVLGVCFFFVLSGFVLTWSARPGDTPRTFWRRRFWRLVPNHVVVYLVALGLLLLAGTVPTLKQGITHLFLLQSWIPDNTLFFPSVNGITWSLSVEVFFYACFPLLILLVTKIRPARLWLWAGVVAGTALLMPWVSVHLVADAPASLFPTIRVSWPQYWFLYFFPVVRALEFTLGMILARIVQSGRRVGFGVLPAAVLVAAAYLASLYVPQEYTFAAIYLVPVGMLIAALAVADIGGRGTFLATRPWVWLGEITYAFFLTHLLVQFYVHGAFLGQWGGTGAYQRSEQWSTPVGLLFLGTLFVFCIGLAWLLYTLVQVPATRRWSKPKAARLAAEAARRDAAQQLTGTRS
jgi:peptidoglycan/LPS O-acetylase OafA/YrhL